MGHISYGREPVLERPADLADWFRRSLPCRYDTRGDWELVPLLHGDGIDLLLIGPQSVFHVVAIEIGFALSAPAPARGRRVHSDRAAS